MKSYKEFLREEPPVNNAGNGQVDGIGVGVKGEPGVCNKNKKKILLTRKPKGRQNGAGS